MKIYAITPAFDDQYLDKIKQFLDDGYQFLQLRDKTADLNLSLSFIEKVKLISMNYPQSKLILNAYNNYDIGEGTILDEFQLAGLQQSTLSDKSSNRFCPKGKFNFLSCHNQTDIGFAIASGFMAATLSPVFKTQSHPEQTDILGIETFAELCATSRIPIFALGGITIDMIPEFQKIKRCAGVSMIRGWFN